MTGHSHRPLLLHGCLLSIYICWLLFFFFFSFWLFHLHFWLKSKCVGLQPEPRGQHSRVIFALPSSNICVIVYFVCLKQKKKKKEPLTRDVEMTSQIERPPHTHSTQYKREKKTFRKKYYPFLFCFVLFLFFSFYSIVFSQSSIFINAILCWETERCPTYIIRYMFTSLIFLFLCPLTYMRQRRGGGHCPFSLVIFILSDENINKQ